MRAVVSVLLLMPALWAQSSSSLVGKAVGVTGNQLVVQTDGRSVLLYAGPQSQIWRGTTGSSLAVIRPGDDVTVRYRQDSSGRLVIENLSANIVHVWGRIRSVAAGQFEVEQNFNADPQSSYRRGLRQIAFDANTQFEASAPADLLAGRTVDIIGLKTSGSAVQATRIIVYEGNRPVRMPAGAAIASPNGRFKTGSSGWLHSAAQCGHAR